MRQVPMTLKVVLIFGLILGQHVTDAAFKFKGKRRGGQANHGLQLGGQKYKGGSYGSGSLNRDYDGTSQVLAPHLLTAYKPSKLRLASVPIMALPSPHYSRSGYEVWNAGTDGSDYGRAIWHGGSTHIHGPTTYGPPRVHLTPEDLIIQPEEPTTWQNDRMNEAIMGGPSISGTMGSHHPESDPKATSGQNKVGKLLALAIAYSYGVPTLPKIRTLLEEEM